MFTAQVKMNRLTIFDTPSEKGSQLRPGNTRSPDTSTLSRPNLGSDGMADEPQVESTPTAASKVT